MVVEARPHVVLTDTELTGVSAKVASRLEGTDILVTSNFGHMSTAKRHKKLVALEVTISNQKDLDSISQALDMRPDYL